MAGPRRSKIIQCAACGKPQEIVALGHTKTYACPACSAVIDMSKPEFEVIFRSQEVQRVPLIPLGTRGNLKGVLWEIIGFTIKTDGTGQYEWNEYLLFNPYHGFRWLVESDQHWNFGTPIKQYPNVRAGYTGKKQADYQGLSFGQFQIGSARTKFILGEFYWEARTGDVVQVADYIAPPLMLSVERSQDEDNWTLLEYQKPSVIYKSFGVYTRPRNIAPNQPNWAKGYLSSVWHTTLVALLILLGIEFFLGRLQLNQKVYEDSFLVSNEDQPKVRVIPLTLKGRTSNLEITAKAAVNNSWIYLDYDLNDLESGDSFGGDAEVAYYHGVDSDGSWSEGSNSASTVFPEIPPGNYSLTVDPELAPNTSTTLTLKVVRDAPYYTNVVVASFIICIPLIFFAFLSGSFESRRWGESGSDSESDSDD